MARNPIPAQKGTAMHVSTESLRNPLSGRRLRRAAHRQGYQLTKDQGRYYLVDPRTNCVMVGSPNGLDAEAVADFLAMS